MKTAIITDSTCDLPAEIIEAYKIEVLPFTIHIDDHDYLDGISITTEELYQAMREGQRPTTSQISPVLIRESFMKHAEKGEPCIYIAFQLLCRVLTRPVCSLPVRLKRYILTLILMLLIVKAVPWQRVS